MHEMLAPRPTCGEPAKCVKQVCVDISRATPIPQGNIFTGSQNFSGRSTPISAVNTVTA